MRIIAESKIRAASCSPMKFKRTKYTGKQSYPNAPAYF